MRVLSALTFIYVLSFAVGSMANAQWIQTSGEYRGTVYCFAVPPADSGTSLFAGTIRGVFLSTDNGTSWTAVNSGLTNMYVNALAVSPAAGGSGTNLFAGTDGGGVFLSTNNGSSWTAVNSGLTNSYVGSLAVSGSSLFAGTSGGGVFRSTNNGTSWIAVNTGLTNTFFPSLAIIGTDLFAGSWGGGVFLSTDNGASWTASNAGLTNTSVLALAVSANETGGTNLFAGTYGGGGFLSTNNGASWSAVNSGLTNYYVWSLATCPKKGGGTIFFAGTGDGVFISTNNCASWTAFSSGLPRRVVHSLAFNGTFLFAGLVMNGIYRVAISNVNEVSSITPLYPPDGTTDTHLDNSEHFPASIELLWKYATGTVITLNTRLQISTDSSFLSDILIDTVLTTSEVQESRSFRVSHLIAGTTYCWRVTLVFPDGSNPQWPGTWKFTTAGGVITGAVFDDLDRDGLRDSGEPGIPYWKLLLTGKCAGDLRTDSDGRYMFAGLDSGSYAVSSLVPDVTSLRTLTYPLTNMHSFALDLDSTKQGADFGWSYPWSSVEGQVFEDANENARFDSLTEHTLPHWPMLLSGYESRQSTTDENGVYIFHQLEPRYYRVKLGAALPGWESTPSGYEAVHEFFFEGYDIHPDHRNFAVHRIPPRVKIELTITEHQVTLALRKLRFGVRPGATYGIWRADSTSTITDYAEGEFELPPLLDRLLDARFVDPANPFSEQFGNGSYIDMRSYYSEAQADTYRIRFQSEVNDPVTIRWSKAQVETSYAGSVIFRDLFMQETDMKQTDSLVVADPSTATLRLIAMGPQMPRVNEVQNQITELPTSFQVAQNFPNPFNPTTTIVYQLPKQSHVTLKIFDVLGREVATLVNGVEEPGNKSVKWDASNTSSGIYFYRISAGSFTETRKLLLLR